MILASIWRDSATYVDRYVGQVKALREHLDVTVIAVEGDSMDDTYARLQATDFHVLKCETGGPRYASVDWKPRWRQLAACGNVALVAAARMAEALADDVFGYVESDLIWRPVTMTTLVDDLTRVSAVAPMSMQGHRFYDGYGYTKDGRMFTPYEPYFDGYRHDTLTTIDTSGSCWVMMSNLLPYVNFSPTECVRGIGQSLKEHGTRLYLDPTVYVEHP